MKPGSLVHDVVLQKHDVRAVAPLPRCLAQLDKAGRYVAARAARRLVEVDHDECGRASGGQGGVKLCLIRHLQDGGLGVSGGVGGGRAASLPRPHSRSRVCAHKSCRLTFGGVGWGPPARAPACPPGRAFVRTRPTPPPRAWRTHSMGQASSSSPASSTAGGGGAAACWARKESRMPCSAGGRRTHAAGRRQGRQEAGGRRVGAGLVASRRGGRAAIPAAPTQRRALCPHLGHAVQSYDSTALTLDPLPPQPRLRSHADIHLHQRRPRCAAGRGARTSGDSGSSLRAWGRNFRRWRENAALAYMLRIWPFRSAPSPPRSS